MVLLSRYTPETGMDYAAMSEISEAEAGALRLRLEQLRLEHRDLDDVIERLIHDPHIDQLQLKRLKKRKLFLKDLMKRLESDLIPDLDA